MARATRHPYSAPITKLIYVLTNVLLNVILFRIAGQYGFEIGFSFNIFVLARRQSILNNSYWSGGRKTRQYQLNAQ